MKNNLFGKIKGFGSFVVPAVVGGVAGFRFLCDYLSENYTLKSRGVYSILEEGSRVGELAVFSAVGGVAIGTAIGATSYMIYNFWREREERLARESRRRLKQRKLGAWNLNNLENS